MDGRPHRRSDRIVARPGAEGSEPLDRLMQRISPHFSRSESRVAARDYVRRLMAGGPPARGARSSDGERAAGENGQRLLRSARWDCDAVRDELASAATAGLGTGSAVLTLTCWDFPKKGHCAVGVDRRFRRSSGRVQNAQTGVLAVLETTTGIALVDRELFLPTSWTRDPERRRRAGVPDAVEFRTSGQLAAEILERGAWGPVEVDWVVCDREVGSDDRLRELLDRSGRRYAIEQEGRRVRLRHPAHGDAVRDTSHVTTPLDRAGAFLDEACDRVGLDTYECRHWVSWYRHITLASMALQCLDQRAAG